MLRILDTGNTEYVGGGRMIELVDVHAAGLMSDVSLTVGTIESLNLQACARSPSRWHWGLT